MAGKPKQLSGQTKNNCQVNLNICQVDLKGCQVNLFLGTSKVIMLKQIYNGTVINMYPQLRGEKRKKRKWQYVDPRCRG